MKKIIMLTAALLLGVGSVFAQNAWEVKADWGFEQDSDCHTLLTNEYGFSVELEIYDDANSNWVTDPDTHAEVGWTVVSYTFPGSKTKVQAYCNDNHDYTPSFTVTVTVRIYQLNTNPPNIVCTASNSESGKTCSNFSNGVLIEGITFN